MTDDAMEQNPRDQLVEELKVTDPILWARESEGLAREVAYLDGRLFSRLPPTSLCSTFQCDTVWQRGS